MPQKEDEVYESRFSDLRAPEPTASLPVTIKQYPHYFKLVPLDPETGLPFTHVDPYLVADMFNIFQPGVAHAVKKLLCAGDHGVKAYDDDLQEAIDCLRRQLQINQSKLFTEAAKR